MAVETASAETARKGWERERKRRLRQERAERKHMEALRDEPMDEAEWRQHLETCVRQGNVQAMKLWWETYGGEARRGDDRFSVIDELCAAAD